MGSNRFVTVVVALVGAIVVAGLFRFNYQAAYYNQYLVGNLMGLFWLPMLTILLVFREEPAKFGFALGSSKRIWYVVITGFAALFVGMLYVSRWPSFQTYYPLFKFYPEFSGIFSRYPAENPWVVAPWLMFYAEASYGMYLFCWEFFFRGYLLFGLSRSIGWWAVIVQAAAFCLLHWGKPPVEVILSFPAGIILGIIALNAKSFLPCFVLHWAASLSFNILAIAARHQ